MPADNHILDASNNAITVTNLLDASNTSSLGGVPLGTTLDSVTGELGLKVHVVSALPVGENHIGQVGGITALITSSPVMTVAGAHATGDYIGPSTTPASFATAFRVAGQGGVLHSLTISDALTTAAVAMELWLFSATFTAPTDNAAWAISDADQLLCIGVIELPAANWYANSNGKVFSLANIGLPITNSAPGPELFYALVARGTTPAWTSGDLQLTAGILQD